MLGVVYNIRQYKKKFDNIKILYYICRKIIDMWFSVELLNGGKIYIQPYEQKVKHGPKGKVLIKKCLKPTADRIKLECES